MTISYDEAIEKVKSGTNMRRPAWPEYCYITYNTATYDLHPDPTIDFVDATKAATTFSPADSDEQGNDWVDA